MTTETEDASMTIGDLSATGLLDITCSGLLNSPDHDVSICSCHGDQIEFGRIGDAARSVVDGPKELEDQQQPTFTSDDVSSPLPEVSENQSKQVPGSPQNPFGSPAREPLTRKHPFGSPTAELLPQKHPFGSPTADLVSKKNPFDSPTEEPLSRSHHQSFHANMSLFNDTSVNMSRLMSRLQDLNEKNESALGTFNYSYADSTKFYSLGVGNLQDLLGKDDLESLVDGDGEEEGSSPQDPVSLSSVGVVEINEDNVSFKTKSSAENPFMKVNGDLDTQRIHEQALIIQKNLYNNEIQVETLVKAFEISLTDIAEKDAEIDALRVQVKDLEGQLLENGAREGLGTSPEPSQSQSLPLSEQPVSEIDDLKLQIANLEKKLEIEKKYLETQTAERELERDDFQKTITELTTKIDDMRREKEHLDLIISNQKTELEDYEVRLRDVTESQTEAQVRSERYEDELKSAVEKIHELRSIIRELEEQIDIATKNATELKEQNLFLQENLEQMEKQREKEAKEREELAKETTNTSTNTDLTEELQAQVVELTRRLERKLNEMDNFQWSTRPNSSCSNAVSVSNEDISVSRDLGYMNKEHVCEDLATQIAEGLQKLDSHFESLVRFEEIIMKKLRDAELRLLNSKKTQEELESEKQVLQEKVKTQILTISDLENRLDQFRFEPSPNTLTLSGLRARVSALNNEVEEYKGQLQLKELELQELVEKLAGKEALLSKLQHAPPIEPMPPAVKKSSVITQTSIKAYNVSTQTKDSNFKAPRSTSNIGIQTAALPGMENLEISSIQGILPVTHSTPNNEATIMKTVARNLRKKHDMESAARFASEFSEHERSPEVLREPLASRMSHSVLSEKFPRIPDLRELEHEQFDKYESDYGDEPQKPKFAKLKDRTEAGDPVTEINIPGTGGGAGGATVIASRGDVGGASASTAKVVASRGDVGGVSPPAVASTGATGVAAATAGSRGSLGSGEMGRQGSGAALDVIDVEPDGDGRVARGSVDEDRVGTGIGGDIAGSGSQVSPAAEVSPVTSTTSKKALTDVSPAPSTISKRAVSNSSQTPPLALANLIDALDEEEKKRLFEELAKAEGLTCGKPSDEKDEEIAKLLNRIKELENVCTENRMKACGPNGGGGSCIIETSLDLDEGMRPVNAETRMNYVVTPSASSTPGKSCADVDPKLLAEIAEIVGKLGSSTALLSMNEEQCKWVHQALTTLVQCNNPSSAPTPAPPEPVSSDSDDSKSYSYEMETIVDFRVGDNGDLNLLGTEAKILPSESIAKVSRGAKPLDRSRSHSRSSRIISVDRGVGGDSVEPDPDSSHVPWDQLQKSQEGRLNEADARVEVEVLKTKLNMMQQALEQEREKAATCPPAAPASTPANADQSSPAVSHLNDLLTHERGKVQELECFVEQQNMEIACLSQKIQELETACSMPRAGDATAPGMFQTPLGLQVADRDMNVTFTRNYGGGGGPDYVGETYLVDPYDTQGTDPSTGLRSAAQSKEVCRVVGQKWYELYLRAKSYRKALAWQKKYLAVVVQGYKDLLGLSGAAFEHPDLLQKQVPITPSSVGLCDKRKGKTRFRIVGKAVIASIRMKYMVSRWTGKVTPRSAPNLPRQVIHTAESSRYASSSSSTDSDDWDESSGKRKCDKPRTVTFSAFSPPTKDCHKTSRSAPCRSSNAAATGAPVGTSQTRVTGSGIPNRDPAFVSSSTSTARRSQASSSSSGQTSSGNSMAAQLSSAHLIQEQQLSQYFERFQTIEKEIGSTISRVAAVAASSKELQQRTVQK